MKIWLLHWNRLQAKRTRKHVVGTDVTAASSTSKEDLPEEKIQVVRAGDAITLPVQQLFLLGALVKIIATTLTYPYIMAKVRLQIDQGKSFKGILDVWSQVFVSAGMTGLFAGLSAQLTKSVLTNAIHFTAKERLLFLLSVVQKNLT